MHLAHGTTAAVIDAYPMDAPTVGPTTTETTGPTRYATMAPEQAVAHLTGVGYDADTAQAMVGEYLDACTARHGEPRDGWVIDQYDLAEIERDYGQADNGDGRDQSIAEWYGALPQHVKDEYEQVAIDEADGTGHPPSLDDIRAGRVPDPRGTSTLGTIGNPGPRREEPNATNSVVTDAATAAAFAAAQAVDERDEGATAYQDEQSAADVDADSLA